MTSTTTGTAVTDLTYDSDGNLTKDETGTYIYDALGRAKTTTIGADTFTFLYDADGNRTTTKKNGAAIRSHQWDVNNSIPRIATDLSQPSGWLLGDYHYGPLGEPQAVDTGAASFYYLHDRQNSITSVRDLSGVENYKYAYGTWGTFTGTAGGGTQQTSVFGFTGTFKDQVSRGKIDLPPAGTTRKPAASPARTPVRTQPYRPIPPPTHMPTTTPSTSPIPPVPAPFASAQESERSSGQPWKVASTPGNTVTVASPPAGSAKPSARAHSSEASPGCSCPARAAWPPDPLA